MTTAPTPVLEVRDLKKHFPVRRGIFSRQVGTVYAVDGISFALNSGETLGLVGESGCGKSTAGKMILKLIEPTAGQIYLHGERIDGLNRAAMRRRRSHLQVVFQDPYASLNPRMRVGDILAEPLALHDIVPASRRRQRVAELLDLVGLDERFGARYPHEFSGGQRQRIAIARALAVEPKLIVCDEPVSALDVSIRSQILNLLDDLQRRLALTYVFISHDLSVVKHIADRVAVMYLGRIVETASADALFAAPRHPYTRALLSAIPVPRPRPRRQRQLLEGDVPSPLAPPPGCHLHPRCAYAIERCRIEPPALLHEADQHATACHRWRELPPAPALASDDGPASRLEPLIAAFTGMRDVRASGGVDTIGMAERTGAGSGHQ